MKTVKLRVYEEVVGLLKGVYVDEGRVVLSCAGEDCVVIFPLSFSEAEVFKDSLKKRLGLKIGILRTENSLLLRDFAKIGSEAK